MIFLVKNSCRMRYHLRGLIQLQMVVHVSNHRIWKIRG